MKLPSVIALKDYIKPLEIQILLVSMFFSEISFPVSIVEVKMNLHLIICYQGLRVEKLIGKMLLQHVQVAMCEKVGDY